MIDVKMPPGYKNYFSELEEKLNKLYQVAERARSLGLDASLEVESKITNDIAERIEKLIGPTGITERMRELSDMDRREMSFKVAQEIALGRFGVMEKQQAADQAIRTALAILTEGVTIAPIEGIPEIKIKENPDRSEFLSIYFAGPIRPAGGTAQALTLVIADIVRKALALNKFQPSEEAVNRFIEEVRIYERSVRRFQYHVTDEDLELAMKMLPVEATGVSTDPYEVSNYRDVSGIETNRLRGGALIVVVDGVVGRARKLCGVCESIGIDGWEWLNKLGKRKTNDNDLLEKKPSAAFMEEIIVGRPVFSFPNEVGGFRLRYGRSRTTGLAACGVHPATMITLNGFMTTGLQLRIELPGKSSTVCPVDTIEPPVVRLKDGTVLRVDDVETAEKVYDKVDKILFNGDILINAGDFIQFNHILLPSGYDEDQWVNDLEKIYRVQRDGNKVIDGLPKERIREFIENQYCIPTPDEALTLTTLGLSLHPRYTYNWSRISHQELVKLRNELLNQRDHDGIILTNESKSVLESLLIPHRLVNGKLFFDEAKPILERCFALNKTEVEMGEAESLTQVNKWAGFQVKEKAFIYVGARMGRPEKAKERKMSPYVHALYPVGNAGGSQRDITRTRRGEKIRVEMIKLECPQCGYPTQSTICENCGSITVMKSRCPRCGRQVESGKCPACNTDTVGYEWIELDLREELEKARKHLGGIIPDRIKCVKRLMNKQRIPENLSKGILRARYDLSVFKDGTLRYDLTDIPLTHFRPNEVKVTVKKLIELGYTCDVNGEPLHSGEQMLELKVQDVILPETCGDYLVKVTKFLDDELKYFYRLEPFYEVDNRDELIGHIILGLAPHTSAAIVGRLIGWTTVRNCYAHPYWHAAKRRNCDGDEDAVLMVLDPLLNFSRSYLPEQSGGLMDAPLFIIPNLNPSEVDKESHNVDVMKRYPSEFYELSMKNAKPSEFECLIDTLGIRLGTPAQYTGLNYTKECSSINLGSHPGAYNKLHTMIDKLDSQLDLTRKLTAVDGQTVALKILNSHFMKDIVGNLRAFTRQGFRCSKCNKKFRRPPLRGVCDRCGGPILMTVHKGGIQKYLDPATEIIRKYDLGDYYSDRIELVREELDSIFEEEDKEKTTQFNLIDFMRPKGK